MSRLARSLALLSAGLVLAACAPGVASTAPTALPAAAEPCAPGAVQVGADAEALQHALDEAEPGAVLQLADTTYAGGFHATASGTAEQPIVLCGVAGSVIDAGDVVDGYALHLDGASYWDVRGLELRGGQKGVVLDGVSHSTLSDLRISDVGQEGLHLRAASTDNLVRAVTIERTGLTDPEYGEGVYVGSAESNWCRYSACQPDRSDRNVFEQIVVADTTAEALDVKEGTSDGVIRSSTLATAREASVDSAVDLKGSGWVLEGSTVTGTVDAVSVHVIVAPWGERNTVSGSDLRTGATGVGVRLAGAAQRAGNVVACDNTVSVGIELVTGRCT